jgi:hypothetical protein
MSVPKYGRVTPLQMYMLGLGGEICRWHHQRLPTDEERMKEMRSSKDILKKMTGQDFGYELEIWHNRLANDQLHRDEYMHPYAWKAVSKRVLVSRRA